MRSLFAAMALLISSSSFPASAQTIPPIGSSLRPGKFWLEPTLWVGPYVWRATSTYISTDEPEPNEHDKQTWTMVGGALGVTVGGWLGKHVALGGTLRNGIAAGVEPFALVKVTPRPFFALQTSVLFAQERTRGVRLLLSGGFGMLASSGSPSLGPAAGLELGYAFPVGNHAVALGAGCDLIVGFSHDEGDHGRYEYRDYLVMPGTSLRFVF